MVLFPAGMDHMDHMHHMNHSMGMDHAHHNDQTMVPSTTGGHDHGGGGTGDNGSSGGHGGMVRGGASHCYMLHQRANLVVASLWLTPS